MTFNNRIFVCLGLAVGFASLMGLSVTMGARLEEMIPVALLTLISFVGMFRQFGMTSIC